MLLDIIIIFIIFFGFITIGMPVFLAMGVSGMVGLYFLKGQIAVLDTLLVAYRGADSFVLVAVPLFVFCGTLMEETGASARLYDFAQKWFGHISNGTGVAVVVSCAIFAAISGSSVATAATIGLVSLPMLAKQGYSQKTRGPLVAAGGTLGILIPPSISMILIGNLTEESVGKLFMAGMLPGILIGGLAILYLTLVAKPKIKGVSFSWHEMIGGIKSAFFVLLLPLVILGGIYTGFATPTEISAIAVIYCLVLGSVLLKTDWIKFFLTACSNALSTSVMIMMIVCFGKVLSQFFTLAQVPQTLASIVTQFNTSDVVVITLVLGIYLVLGCFMEAVSMVLLTVPMFFPVFQALGISPMFFGVFVTIAMELAQITPPVGINLYVISGVGNIPIEEMIKGILPYVIMMIIALYIIWYLPVLYDFLPALMKF